MASSFLAVQFEFTHAIGPHAGRYIVAHPSSVDSTGAALRSDALTRRQQLSGQTMQKGTADVLAISVDVAPARIPKLRRKAKEAEVDSGPAEVPLLLATFIRGTRPLDRKVADAELLELSVDEDAQQAWVAEGLLVLNRAIRAYRAGSRDPYVREVAQRDSRTTRIGYGTTESLPNGKFTRAAVLPLPLGLKASREERLAPSETTANVLAGRASVLEGEDLLLRAYTDLDHGRTRAAALQVRAAVHLLELELRDLDGGNIGVDFDELANDTDRIVAAIAGGPLEHEQVVEVEAIVERIEHAIELWRFTPRLETS
ncbi:hypothetical protein DSM112329_04546 [Paraconexibacter sp. AEG42_29]|uniref:Uncharacterized protein n=1 Tax=Paraconexibacter sp. AEG42_29 TaxID=2997339 RepID=A0AAU7B131_9ACTN